MNYTLLQDLIQLMQTFESETATQNAYPQTIEGFKHWITGRQETGVTGVAEWEGKAQGRSADSVLNTLIVHLNRYARTYAKAAILGSDFATQEEFIYLINLKAFGAMSKTALIKRNVQDKPAGMQIIHRLIQQQWVSQQDSTTDRRSKTIAISPKGLQALERQMASIRKATRIVAGDLSPEEKTTLIHLLHKLDQFHKPLYLQNISSDCLLQQAEVMLLERTSATS